MAKKTKKKTPPKKSRNFLFKKRAIKDFESLPLKNFYIYSVIISTAAIAAIYFGQKNLPPEIPLFYGKSAGQERLGSNVSLVIPPFSSLCITIINLTLSFVSKNQYLKKVLAITSLTVTLFALITVVKIFLLVGNI